MLRIFTIFSNIAGYLSYAFINGFLSPGVTTPGILKKFMWLLYCIRMRSIYFYYICGALQSSHHEYLLKQISIII